MKSFRYILTAASPSGVAAARLVNHRIQLAGALALMLATGLGVAVPGAAEVPYSRLVVFGDSYSSAGNFHAATGGFVAAPPYHEGRFTNGPVWVDIFATELGLEVPAPSILGGTNYSWGGSESGPGLSVFGFPNLELQIVQFLADHVGPSEDDLLVVAGGSGDLVWQPPYSPATIVNNIVSHIRMLSAAGGRHFLVANLVSVGKSPQMLGTPDEQRSDSLALRVNAMLGEQLRELESELDVSIMQLEMGGLMQVMLQLPEAFGLRNTTEAACPACTGGIPAPDAADSVADEPDRYLWWDLNHASRVFHAALGKMAVEIVERNY